MKIGRHVSISGSLDLAFDRAVAAGCDTMQIFTGNPRTWLAGRLSDAAVAKFEEKRLDYGISPVVAHMPYLPNLANQRDEIYRKSVRSLAEQVERCNALGIWYLVLHLGSKLSLERRKSVENIANAVAEQADYMEGMILLENQAGQANSMGSDMDELREIRELIGSRNVGYCIDTCHAFAAGYDITKEQELVQIDSILGADNIKVLHLNDSRFGLGMHKDRHENIGRGLIGLDGFSEILGHYSKARIPFILETECIDEKQEREEIASLRSLSPKA